MRGCSALLLGVVVVARLQLTSRLPASQVFFPVAEFLQQEFVWYRMQVVLAQVKQGFPGLTATVASAVNPLVRHLLLASQMKALAVRLALHQTTVLVPSRQYWPALLVGLVAGVNPLRKHLRLQPQMAPLAASL
jgi:hypothetical protein